VTSALREEASTMTQHATSIRFQKPAPATFSRAQSALSIFSLVVMTALTVLMLFNLVHPAGERWRWLGAALPFLRPPRALHGVRVPTWVWLPFAFSLVGAGVGALFEIWLFVTGTPFQQARTPLAATVTDFRHANLGPVTATIFFLVCAITVADPALRLALLYVAGAGGVGLAFALFFRGGAAFVPLVLVGTQGVQAVLVISAGPLPGGAWVAGLLVAQAVLQTAALLAGAETPLRSTAFHVLTTASGLVLYRAVVLVTESHPHFWQAVAPALPSGSLPRWGLVVASLGGLWASARLFPEAYNRWRVAASNAVWSVAYFALASTPRFRQPVNLSVVYAKGRPARTRLQAYSLEHPEHLSAKLSIPAPEEIEASVTALGAGVVSAKRSFRVIAWLDQRFPQSQAGAPLAERPRVEIWSDGSDYWPRLFTLELFGRTVPGTTLEATPLPALEAYRAGQILAYLSESSIATTLLAPAPGRGQGALVLELGFLEGYETKPEYERYGGRAYFRVNGERRRLELVSVVAPGSTEELAVDPDDATFRRAESLVAASVYYQIITGKHLAEIHMTYNLVEVAMHNAFDAAGQWAHPFRTFMYLHLFSHQLAEEVTTEHLVQDGAVFAQIFATTRADLMNHLDDTYRRFEYGKDEDFEARAAMMTTHAPGGETALLPRAAITWELRYVRIWARYTGALIDAIYADDEAVRADAHLQAFHAELLAVLPRGLPARYHALRTKAGVARYALDTIHHLVVRHQIYGTTSVRAGLDPRISATQVPRDGGPPGVDDWRALACIALVTGRARFTLLRGDFAFLIDGVARVYDAPMRAAFARLQADLEDLEAEWTRTAEDRAFNYDYMRPLPSSLRTGPGY
jgi:hypothetical protein